MTNVKRTKDCFLYCLSVIYLIAFSSLYVQAPGLYGDNGILPAKNILNKVPASLEDFIAEQPSLLRFLPHLGIDADSGIQLFCLLGMLLSFVSVVWSSARDMANFTVMWALYFSIYQVGQTFLWFQWDILLLEAGFLAILLAPLNVNLMVWSSPRHSAVDGVVMWLVRWLLFRLMFASGVVKLTSGCPTWWGLTALDWHYESQCIPTPMAWYFHQLPKWFQQWSVVATYIIEIVIPLLFFVPLRNVRWFAFYSQMLLQVLIIVTGNYNFFNLLTMVLCLSLLIDNDFTYTKRKENALWRVLALVVSLTIYSMIVYFSVTYFSLKFKEDWTLSSQIAFDEEDLNLFLKKAVPLCIYAGATYLAFELLAALWKSITVDGGMKKLWNLGGTLLIGTLACGIFTMSLVPFTYLDETARHNLPHSARSLHQRLDKFEIVSSYGLFRRMTGVGGRPEVVVEGSMDPKGPWVEYEFLYKPGDVNRGLFIVAPHQPRLDWQMWFAALGNYQHNPWFVNLVYRLLMNEPQVIQLMGHNPFPKDPPLYVRAVLYHYHYTDFEKAQNGSWWWRERKAEYFPAMSLNEPSLIKFLKDQGIVGKKPVRKPYNPVVNFVQWLRSQVGQPEGFTFVMGTVAMATLVSGISQRILGL